MQNFQMNNERERKQYHNSSSEYWDIDIRTTFFRLCCQGLGFMKISQEIETI